MASFTAGTTFVDGVSNDVTAAKLGALVTNATPTSGFIQDRTAETVTATNDTLLIGDASDSNNLKRITVANFAQTLPTAKVTTGTIETGTFGTTTSTAATITTGTIPTLVATTLVTTGTGTAAAPAIVPTGDTNTGIFFPAADTIAFSEGGTESMRIDSSGNVGIGSTGPQAVLDLGNASSGRGITWAGAAGADRYNSIFSSYSAAALVFSSGFHGSTSADSYISSYTGTQGLAGIRFDSFGATAGNIKFFTNATAVRTGGAVVVPTERMRIDSDGNLLVGTTDTSFSAGVGLKFRASATAPIMGYVMNTAGVETSYNLFNTNATNNGFRFYVNTNGGISNFSGNNVNLSDERLKTNINLAGNYLDKICSIPVKTFNYKDQGEDTEKTIGVLAQEVEAHIPELINNDGFGETPADGIPLKTIYQTDLQYVLMRCIQEQQAMIQELSAKVTALEAA